MMTIHYPDRSVPASIRWLNASLVVVVLQWFWGLYNSTQNQNMYHAMVADLWRLAGWASALGLLSVVLVWALLRVNDESIDSVGLTFKRWGWQLVVGGLAGLLLVGFNGVIIGPLVNTLVPVESYGGVDMRRLFQDTGQFPLWAFLALFKGGFAEEIWRVFGLTRFERRFGRSGLYVALVVGSVAFGFEHLYQGVEGAVSVGILGFMFGLIYVRRRRLLEVIVAHAVFDLIGIGMAYSRYAP